MTQDNQALLTLANFSLATSYCRDKRRGGTCIIVRAGLRYKVLENIKKMSVKCLMECCAIELIDYNMIIICMYRVPGTCLDTFHEGLENVLYTACMLKNRKVVICGDFNIDTLKQTTTSRDFIYQLLSHNLKLEFKQATRFISGTCLDNFAHNIKGTKGEVLELSLSDHAAQILKCPVNKLCTMTSWNIRRRIYNQEHLNRFREHIKCLSFNNIFSSNDANIAYDSFWDIFGCLYGLCFPFVTIKRTTRVRPKWITRGIKTCCRKKRESLWLYRLNKSNKNKIAYTIYAKRLKKIIKMTQCAQNNYFIANSNNKTKATWQTIHQSKSNLPKEPISKIKIDNNYLTNPTDIATAFNDYFVDVIEQNSINKNKTYPINMVINPYSIFMSPVTPDDVHRIILTLKNTGSVGFDGISTKVIKYVCDLISPPLAHIINLSLTTGVYPDNLKLAVIQPLYKKDNRENMSSYRPVAKLCIFSKIFEKHFCNCLYSFFEKHKLLVEEQKGFRKNMSINMAIYDLVAKVVNCMDKRIPSCAIYMDMTKAFDHVDHQLLLYKLNNYGIRGNALRLMTSYLEGREQYTELTRICSRTKKEEIYVSGRRKVKYGVPQGSVLGPLLFLVYINDITNSSEHPMVLFADDCTVLVELNPDIDCEREVNTIIKNIIEWLEINNLKANLGKTCVMQFSQRLTVPKLSVNFEGGVINKTEVTKFLGLYIDSDMSWKSHSLEICSRLYKFSYALYKLAKISDRKTVLTAYHGFVASTLRYGLVFWGNSTHRELIFRAQKRCIRAICGLKPWESCQPFFKLSGLLTFPCLYIFECCVFVKCNPNLFHMKKTIQDSLRPRKPLVFINKSNTALMKKSMLIMAPKLFNKLPTDWQNININKFKRMLSELLCDKCYYNVTDYLNDSTISL